MTLFFRGTEEEQSQALSNQKLNVSDIGRMPIYYLIFNTNYWNSCSHIPMLSSECVQRLIMTMNSIPYYTNSCAWTLSNHTRVVELILWDLLQINLSHAYISWLALPRNILWEANEFRRHDGNTAQALLMLKAWQLFMVVYGLDIVLVVRNFSLHTWYDLLKGWDSQ